MDGNGMHTGRYTNQSSKKISVASIVQKVGSSCSLARFTFRRDRLAPWEKESVEPQHTTNLVKFERA